MMVNEREDKKEQLPLQEEDPSVTGGTIPGGDVGAAPDGAAETSMSGRKPSSADSTGNVSTSLDAQPEDRIGGGTVEHHGERATIASAVDDGGGDKGLEPGEAPGIRAVTGAGKETASAGDAVPDVVTFENVTKTFPTPDGGVFTAIHDVSFTVPDLPDVGEFIAILGPSGCGKSTVLNIIAGLEPSYPPTSGKVLVRGEPVRGPGPDRGMVFQSYSSFPCYTVLENVAMGLLFQGVPREEREELAMTWIRKVKLAGSEYKYPHQLSGGMRQRVAIARSLVLQPKIILMDEPFGALDRITRWQMQDLLVELWNEVEATVFLVTHDIAEAVYLGDRIYLFSGSPGTLLEEIKVPPPSGDAAATQRTAEFSELVNEISLKVERPLREAQAAGASGSRVVTSGETDGSSRTAETIQADSRTAERSPSETAMEKPCPTGPAWNSRRAGDGTGGECCDETAMQAETPRGIEDDRTI